MTLGLPLLERADHLAMAMVVMPLPQCRARGQIVPSRACGEVGSQLRYLPGTLRRSR